MYNILLVTEAAEDFFCLLLPKEKRSQLRNIYHKGMKIKAYGTNYADNNKISVNKCTIKIYTNILPKFISIEYNNDNNFDFSIFHSVIIWVPFPAEDNLFLEHNVFEIYDSLYKYTFLKTTIFLFMSDIRTGVTDLNKQENSIQEAKDKCRKKYIYSSVEIILDEVDFADKLLLFAMSADPFDQSVVYLELKKLIQDIEDSINDEKEYFQYILPYDETTDGILSRDQLSEICKWESIEDKNNIYTGYYNSFISSIYYKEIEKQLADYYWDKIKSICVWNKESDISKLKSKLTHELIGYSNKNSRKIAVPIEAIDYISNDMYSELQLEFLNNLNEFFVNEARDLIFNHIYEKIEMYRRKIYDDT